MTVTCLLGLLWILLFVFNASELKIISWQGHEVVIHKRDIGDIMGIAIEVEQCLIGEGGVLNSLKCEVGVSPGNSCGAAIHGADELFVK